MATPISYGLFLEGEDARKFEEYMANPTFTELGLETLREVKRRRIAEGKQVW